MKNKNNIPDELEKLAPFLSKIEKENHFATPKDYFEVLPEVITNKNLGNKHLKLFFDKLSLRILIPVSTLVVVFFILYNLNSNNMESELSHEQLSELIIEDDYIEIEDYLIYDTYAEVMEEEEKENKTDTETEEYIDYLIENDIDINSIIEEL